MSTSPGNRLGPRPTCCSGPAPVLLDLRGAHKKFNTNAGAHLQPRAVPNLMSSYQDTEEDSALEINSITQGYTYSGQRQARANQHDYSRVSIMLIRTLTFGRAFWFASVASDSKHLSPSVLCRPELVSLPSPPDQRVTDG